MILHFPPDHRVTAEDLVAMTQEFVRNGDQAHADALLLLAHSATKEEIARWTEITEALYEQVEHFFDPLAPTRPLQ